MPAAVRCACADRPCADRAAGQSLCRGRARGLSMTRSLTEHHTATRYSECLRAGVECFVDRCSPRALSSCPVSRSSVVGAGDAALHRHYRFCLPVYRLHSYCQRFTIVSRSIAAPGRTGISASFISAPDSGDRGRCGQVPCCSFRSAFQTGVRRAALPRPFPPCCRAPAGESDIAATCSSLPHSRGATVVIRRSPELRRPARACCPFCPP